MDAKLLWNLFWQTGLPEAYLLMRTLEREEQEQTQAGKTA